MSKLTGAVFLMLLCVIASATPRLPQRISSGLYYGPEWAWTREAWTGNDTPYRSIRDAIDVMIAKGKKPDDLYPKYQVLAEQHPSDPQAQFRWTYAAYKAATEPGVTRHDGIIKMGRAEEELAVVSQPHSYEYDRLRFLVESYYAGVQNALNDAGKRFLKQEPGNIEIRHCVIQNLTDAGEWRDYPYNRVFADQKKALAMAQEFLQAHPSAAWPYRTIGDIHHRWWTRTNQPSEANQAIASYRQYLQAGPENNQSRSDTEATIKQIQDGQVSWHGRYVPRAMLPDSMRNK